MLETNLPCVSITCLSNRSRRNSTEEDVFKLFISEGYGAMLSEVRLGQSAQLEAAFLVKAVVI